MKNSKSSLCQDRLSELPESIIFRIFWLLPMRDFVRTAVLSQRWRKLWTTTPCLNFDYTQIQSNQDHIRKFINRALVLWEGTNIHKFKMDFYYETRESFFIDFDFWVYFALGKKVQELYLNVDPYNDIDGKVYSVPQYLYASSCLKALSLKGAGIGINGNVGNVQWKQLKRLTIDGEHTTASAIDQILRGSPQLEVFVLALVNVDCHWNDPNWTIRSSSLKSLSIDNYVDEGGPWRDMELRIWTPNLEELKISGTPFNKCLLMDVSSLTHAKLGFDGVEGDNNLSYENDFLEAALRQIFPTFQQVEKLVLSDWCIKVLGDMNKEYLLSPSSNVKLLKLNNLCVKYKQIVGVLEIFPEVTMLALRGIPRYYNQVEQEPLEFETNLPKSFLQHLRTTQITCRKGGNLMFPLIKIVLKYASKLDKMVMRGGPPSGSLHLASQKLLRMPRSSPTAELIFFEN